MSINRKKEYLSATTNLLNLLSNEGIVPVFLTINLPYEIKKDDYSNINLLIKKIQALTIKQELFSIYLYIAIEENEKENIHFHCLWGIRSIIRNNKQLEDSIKKDFMELFEDVWINIIWDKKNLNNKIYYIFKNKKIFQKKEENIYWMYIFTHVEYQNTRGNFFSILMDISDNEEWSLIHDGFEKSKSELELIKTNSIFDNTNIDELVNILNLYLLYNNIYLHRNILYKKEDELQISFTKIGELKNLIEEFDNITQYFNTISLQLRYYNWYDFKLSNFNKIDEKLEKIMIIYTKKINIDQNFIEFRDCIINLATNQKITKTKNNETLINLCINEKIGTDKYKKILYKNIKKPKLWLEMLEIVTKSNPEKINTIKRFISNIFIKNESKKRVLYIVGKSNTFKTTLIALPIVEYLGEENIGFLATNSNFTFQDIEKKKILLLDEFKYEQKHKKNYLKLFEGNSILVEKKYKNASKEKINTIFILTNDKLDNKIEPDNEILAAIQNRVEIVEFEKIEQENVNHNELKKYIKENNIEIIIWAAYENDKLEIKTKKIEENKKKNIFL